MLPDVRRDILSVLRKAQEYVQQRDQSALAELSNRTIHNASIYQDEDSVSIAVVVYALSKLVARGARPGVVQHLAAAEEALRAGNLGLYSKTVHRLTTAIGQRDTQLKLYISRVLNQSQIKKGSKLYDHGISMARAADMLGVSQWELMGYVGKTQMIDRTEKARRVLSRLKTARQLFR